MKTFGAASVQIADGCTRLTDKYDFNRNSTTFCLAFPAAIDKRNAGQKYMARPKEKIKFLSMSTGLKDPGKRN